MTTTTVIAFCGSTGVGKTRRATSLARQYTAPVLVLDRIQVYDDMAILSGRPRAEEIGDTTRIYLDQRPTCRGELTVEQSYWLLATHLQQLQAHHNSIILEGGSISLWRYILEHGLPLASTSGTFDALHFCVSATPDLYRQKIETRIHEMIGDGLLGECTALCACSISQMVAHPIIGYTTVAQAVQEQWTESDLVQNLTNEHYAYAQQQYAFFASTLVPSLAMQGVHIYG